MCDDLVACRRARLAGIGGAGALAGLILGSGCSSERSYLPPTLEAWGEQVVEAADPAARVGLGMASLAAATCALDQDDWDQAVQSGLELEEGAVSWWGMNGSASVDREDASGLVEVAFDPVELLMEQDSAFEVFVTLYPVIPTEEIRVVLSTERHADTGGGDTGTEATLVSTDFATRNCGPSTRQVSGTMTYEAAGWTVSVPEDTDSYAGWEAGGTLPVEGDMAWSGTSDAGRANLLTEDASLREGWSWTAEVWGQDWSTEVVLELE